jgi:hypothetical protein
MTLISTGAFIHVRDAEVAATDLSQRYTATRHP